MNNDGDTARLLHPDGSVADQKSFTTTETNQAYERYPDGGATWLTKCIPTPKKSNCSIVPAPTPTRTFALTSIADARTLPAGSRVAVLGSVIAHPCEFDSFGHEMMLSDGATGIDVYLAFPGRMSCLIPWDEQLVVTGVLTDHLGFREVRPASNVNLTRHYDLPKEISPRAIHTGGLDDEFQSMLLTVQGEVANGRGGDVIWVDDGTGAVEVHTNDATGASVAGITHGSTVRITGVGYQVNSSSFPERGYYLLPREPDDIVVLELADKPENAPGKHGGIDLGPVSAGTVRTTKLRNYVTIGGVVTVPPAVIGARDFWVQDANGGASHLCRGRSRGCAAA